LPSSERESPVPFQVMADALPTLMAYVDREGRYRYNNRAYEDWFGRPREAIVGRHLCEVLGPSAYEAIRPHVEAALSGQPAHYEAEVPYRAGMRWVRASYIPHRDERGAVSGFVALVVDVSASKQTEAALQQARDELDERVRQRTAELSRASAMLCAVELAVQAGVAAVDRSGRQVYVNPAFCRMLGWRAEELLGASPPFVYWPPEEVPAIERAFELAMRGQAPPEGFELRFVRKDGQRFLAQILLAPLSDGEGRPDGWVASLYDVTERNRVEESLRRSEMQLAEAQRLAGLGSWEWSLDDNRVSWSGELHRIYGLRPGAFGGTLEGFLERVHPEDRQNTRSNIEEAYRSGLPFGFEERILRPDGSVRTLYSQGKVIKDDAGRVVRMVGTCQDVTERKKAEEERAQLYREQAARAAAEKANRLKDEFLATLSHELRTPLNAIVGWAHMLHAGGLDEETTRRAIETISRNAMIQNQLISDILDIQRISSGKLRLNLQPADPMGLVEAAIDTVRPAATAKEIQLAAHLEPDAGPVLADPDRLQQIVWNLLSNAVKFCPRGGRVDVRLTRDDASAEVTVEDDGPGINPEFLPYIFERFRQGDASSTRRQGGLGLGLAIVRSLVELHGGTVRAANRSAGTGAVFQVRLPRLGVWVGDKEGGGRPRPRPVTVEQEVWLDRAPSLHGTRVLVIDDEPDAREVVASVLERCGADVIVAGSAAEAMPIVERDRPDVVLSDIEMPEEDGYSLMRRIRELPTDRGGLTPAAALTAYAGTEDRIRVLDAGFQMHVPKPVQPAELAAVVASLSGRSRPMPSPTTR